MASRRGGKRPKLPWKKNGTLTPEKRTVTWKRGKNQKFNREKEKGKGTNPTQSYFKGNLLAEEKATRKGKKKGKGGGIRTPTKRHLTRTTLSKHKPADRGGGGNQPTKLGQKRPGQRKKLKKKKKRGITTPNEGESVRREGGHTTRRGRIQKEKKGASYVKKKGGHTPPRQVFSQKQLLKKKKQSQRTNRGKRIRSPEKTSTYTDEKKTTSSGGNMKAKREMPGEGEDQNFHLAKRNYFPTRKRNKEEIRNQKGGTYIKELFHKKKNPARQGMDTGDFIILLNFRLLETHNQNSRKGGKRERSLLGREKTSFSKNYLFLRPERSPRGGKLGQG